MKIKQIILENFRGYKEPTKIDFNDLTVFVGKNDIGKSSILEALDLFFYEGKGTIKYDSKDINIFSDNRVCSITVVFKELPEKVILDSSYETSLAEEYLLNSENDLEIVKRFNNSKCTGTYIKAMHPTNPSCADLHLKKKTDLKRIIQTENLSCTNMNINAVMRKSIWNNHESDLQKQLIEIDVTAGEDTKCIWSKLVNTMPVFSLFRADRENSDGDKEVQDPLKIAVAQFFKDEEIQETLKTVAEKVEAKLKEVAARTVAKLSEMDNSIASSLEPVIPNAESLKWADVFKQVSITGDDDVPINKRGSGVKRLILLNFFRAEAERRQEENSTGIIYAIEEPETSQHFANQRKIADALITLSKLANTQVIMTTHSGVIVKKLEHENLRLISEDCGGKKLVSKVQSGLLGFASLNEVNFTAFDEITEEYHDELYGFIYDRGWLSEYESGKHQREYIRKNNDGSQKREQRTLTRYIRDVFHHPENTFNEKYTFEELTQSIYDMRTFIAGKS